MSGEQRMRMYRRGVGALVVVTLAALAYLINYIGSESNPFVERIHLHALMERAHGVSVNTPVSLAGIVIGQVTDLEITADNRIRVTLAMRAEYRDRLRLDSVAMLQQPLLGNPYIDWHAGRSDAALLPPGARIQIQRAPEVGDIVATLPRRLDQVDQILSDVAHITGAQGPLQAALADLHRASGQMAQLTTELNRDDGALQVSLSQVERMTRDLAELSQSLQGTQTQVDELLVEGGAAARTVNRHLPTSMQRLEAILGELRQVSQAMSELAPQLPQALHAGQSALDEAQDVLRAAKRSVLLRGNLPQPEERSLLQAPRIDPAQISQGGAR